MDSDTSLLSQSVLDNLIKEARTFLRYLAANTTILFLRPVLRSDLKAILATLPLTHPGHLHILLPVPPHHALTNLIWELMPPELLV
jgi:hypothetical protein